MPESIVQTLVNSGRVQVTSATNSGVSCFVNTADKILGVPTAEMGHGWCLPLEPARFCYHFVHSGSYRGAA